MPLNYLNMAKTKQNQPRKQKNKCWQGCTQKTKIGKDMEKLETSYTAEFLKWYNRDFPCGTVVKNPPANAEDTGLSPGPGRSHMLWSN